MAYLIDADWYYMERTTSELWQELVGLPGLLGGLFGLGPLFLLGGVFAAASLARKGPRRFVHGRLLRLGAPLVLFVAVITPLANYLGDLAQGMGPRLWPYLAPGSEDHDVGPLWFVAALLTFSLAYAARRWWRPGQQRQRGGDAAQAAADRGRGDRRGLVCGAAAVALWQRHGPGSPVARVVPGLGAVHPGVLWGEQGWRGRGRWPGRAAAGRSRPPG